MHEIEENKRLKEEFSELLEYFTELKKSSFNNSERKNN